jgi:separase
LKAVSVINKAESKCGDDNDQQRLLIANYTRCVSGAFYNAAGSLYKSGKYGHAVRFLNDAAPLAAKALQQYDNAVASAQGNDTQANEKDVEVWKSHRAQLHKRYELLAACQVKLGNRKVSCNLYLGFNSMCDLA